MSVYTDVLKLRDAVRNMVQSEIKKSNLLPRYAVVKEVPVHSSKRVLVLLNGTPDVTDNYLPVVMNSTHPVAIGDVVRVEGSGGDQYISEVITPRNVYLYVGTVDATGVIITSLPTITGGVALVWDPATGRVGRA